MPNPLVYSKPRVIEIRIRILLHTVAWMQLDRNAAVDGDFFMELTRNGASNMVSRNKVMSSFIWWDIGNLTLTKEMKNFCSRNFYWSKILQQRHLKSMDFSNKLSIYLAF